MSTRTLLFGAAVLVASTPLAAQTAAAPPVPATGSIAPSYSSAFNGYRPFDAGQVQDWRKSNDTVRDIGGWRAYAREMQEGSPAGAAGQAAPNRPAPAARPAPGNVHEGHHR